MVKRLSVRTFLCNLHNSFIYKHKYSFEKKPKNINIIQIQHIMENGERQEGL